uniref:Uncharacterized protein n=1 Tax=Arundo donax TaxID=35708 RepID=A0A0A8YKG9_ARUDO
MFDAQCALHSFTESHTLCSFIYVMLHKAYLS